MAMKNGASEDTTLDLGEAQDPTVKIDLREGDDEEGGEEQEAGGERPGGERPRDDEGKWTRQKRERAKNKKDETTWRTEKAQLEGRLQEMQQSNERQLAALRSEMAASANARRDQTGGQGAANPFEAQFQELDAALATELQLIEADPKRDYKRYNSLRRRETALVAKQAMWEANQGQQQGQQQGQSSPYAARFEIMRAEFPWLGDTRFSPLIDKTRNMRNYLINVEGLPDTLDTDRQAAAQVLAKFGSEYGLRAPAAPSERTRALYTGPRQGTGPRRQEGMEEVEVDVPRGLAAASGLSAQSLRAALREK